MSTHVEVVPARMGGAMVWSLMKRGLNEILRVPGAAVPGMLAPTIFLLGLTSVFGKLTLLPHVSRRSEALWGPLNGLFVDG